MKGSITERFWSKVDKTAECWLWTSNRLPTGYGTFHLNGKAERAHRVAWILKNGKIPDGMEVCHVCDNPPCVRLDHLWLGTHAENMADSSNKGRATNAGYKGEECGSAKLTEQDVSVIRRIRRLSPVASYGYLARQFGVTRQAIYRIVHRETWDHVL